MGCAGDRAVPGRVPASRVLLVACFGAFLAFLDATIVNVAFPSIRDSFPESSIGALSWVLNAYNIVFAAFLIVCGRLTDLLGRRRAFVGGIAALHRRLGAVRGGALARAPGRRPRRAGARARRCWCRRRWPSSWRRSPAPRRAHAIGLWGATAAVAAGLGPPIGGALVELGGWRWAFLVNIPFGVVALVVARRQLVESRAPGRRTMPDLAGAAVLAAALAALNLGIVKGGDWGWSSPAVLGCFAAAALLTALFVAQLPPSPVAAARPRAAADPVVQPGRRRHRAGRARLLRLPPDEHPVAAVRVGVRRAAGRPGAGAGSARRGGRGRPARPPAERHGYRPFVVPGALVWAGAYLWYHEQVGLEPAFWSEWLPGQVLSGIGVGATLPLLGSAALAAVPGGRYATASAVVSSARQLGGVLGIALPRGDRREPHTGDCPDRAARRLAALGRARSSRSRSSPCPGPAHDHVVRRRGGRRRRGRRAHPGPGRADRDAGCRSVALSDLPLLGGLPDGRPGTARGRHPAGPGARGRVADPRGGPAGSGLRGA